MAYNPQFPIAVFFNDKDSDEANAPSEQKVQTNTYMIMWAPLLRFVLSFFSQLSSSRAMMNSHIYG